jgi:hypothetical protein
MQRSIGITISAVIAFIGSAFSILLGLLTVLPLIAVRNAQIPTSPSGQPVSPIPFVVMTAFLLVFYIGFGAWGIVSAIGLLRLRNWARICFAIFGGILCLVSVFGAFGSLMAMQFVPRTLPPGNDVPAGLITGMFVVFGIVALLCTGLGVWWMIYFNRSRVRVQFIGEAAAAAPRRFPLSIIIIAWMLLVGGLMGSLGLVFLFSVSYPLLLFGFVFHGTAAKLLYLLFVGVCIAAGSGMLRGYARAHALAVGYFIFALLNALSYIIRPSSFSRFMQEVPGGQNLPPDFMNAFFPIGNIVGLLCMGLLLWFLITRRQRFIEACVR